MAVRSTIDVEGAFEEALDRVEGGLWAFALDAEAKAKDTAPWTDDTANARNSIQAFSERRGSKIYSGILGHTSYFKHLELGMEKRYAVLEPTVRSYAARIGKWLRGVIDRPTIGTPRTIDEAEAASVASQKANSDGMSRVQRKAAKKGAQRQRRNQRARDRAYDRRIKRQEDQEGMD